MRTNTFYLVVLGIAVSVIAHSEAAGQFVRARQRTTFILIAGANRSTPRPYPKRFKARTAESAAQVTEFQTEVTPQTTQAWSRTRRCDPTQQEQTNLSGTYTGRVNYPEAGLTGYATLTISGDNFALTTQSVVQTGRVTAVTTCGYTAAAMMFGDLAPWSGSNAPPAPTVSLRVWKFGDRMTFMTVAGETRSFTFEESNDLPKDSDFPVFFRTGQWSPPPVFSDAVVRVIQEYFLGYIPRQEGGITFYVTTYRKLENPNRNLRSQIAVRISQPYDVNAEKFVYRVQFVARDRPRLSDAWRYGEDRNPSTITAAKEFVDKLVEDLAAAGATRQ